MEQASVVASQDGQNQKNPDNKTGIHNAIGSNKKNQIIHRQSPNPDVEVIPSTQETTLWEFNLHIQKCQRNAQLLTHLFSTWNRLEIKL